MKKWQAENNQLSATDTEANSFPCSHSKSCRQLALLLEKSKNSNHYDMFCSLLSHVVMRTILSAVTTLIQCVVKVN